MANISKVKIDENTFDVKDNNAIENITRNGTTFTATKRDGSTFTFNQQDSDTTYAAGVGITISGVNNDINVAYGTSANTACQGNDSRLSDSRNAKDVYAWAKASTKPSYTASEVGAIASSLKGSNNGVAELDANGKVPSTQLPSYVDDVIEGYLYNGKFYKESTHVTEIDGESGKIYVDLSTDKSYRWSGTAFSVISDSVALGETSSTAYRGDRGKIAYDHSQSTHARTDATKTEASSTNGNIKINGTETTVYTHPGSGTNPHGTTKSDVGLGNVGNFKAVSTVASQGLTDTEKSNARANIGAGTSNFSGNYNDLTNKPTITNNAVTQTATNTNANYEVLFSATADNTTRTEGARKYSNFLFNPSTGNLQVTQLNGVTIGSSPKFTDTNTWRGIQNNLTSDSTTESLSAAQGKALANGSARDSTKVAKAGDTITGTLNFSLGISGGTTTSVSNSGVTVTSGGNISNSYKYNGISVKTDSTTTVNISNEELSYLDGATSNIQEQLDNLNNLEIGGRNLLPRFSNFSDGVVMTCTYEYDDSTGIYVLKSTSSSAGTFKQIYVIDAVSNPTEYAGKMLMFSAKSITSSRTAADPKVYIYVTKTDNSVWTSPPLDKSKLQCTITMPSDTKYIGYIIRIDQNRAEQVGETATFVGIKLEVGNKATDWAPAPEDKQDTLTAGNNIIINNNVISATDTWRGIQNNLTSTSTTESLSAYQGKLLNDNKLGYIKYAKDVSTNFNNITASGIYYLNGTTMSNAPSSYTWGYLIVIAYNEIIRQIVINGNNIISSRQYSGSPASWSSWHVVLTNNTGVSTATVSGSFYAISNFQKYASSNTANITANGTNYLITLTTSDKNLKKNIEDTKINALEVINNLKHKQFDYRYEELGKDKIKIGYIAQELEKVIPESVIDIPQNEETSLGGLEVIKQIDYNAIVPYLTKAIQELSEIVEEQQKVIDKYITNNEIGG